MRVVRLILVQCTCSSVQLMDCGNFHIKASPGAPSLGMQTWLCHAGLVDRQRGPVNLCQRVCLGVPERGVREDPRNGKATGHPLGGRLS